MDINEEVYNWKLDETSKYVTIKSKVENIDLFTDLINEIENPTYIDEGNNICYFDNNGEITIEQYIKGIKLTSKIIDIIMIKLFKIFLCIESKGLIIPSASLSDFWISDNDITTIKYRVRRKFINNNQLVDNYLYSSDVVAPEIDRALIADINKSANVYLIVKLFQKLIFSEEKNINIEKEAYSSYFLNMFRPDISYEYHEFIIRNTSIFYEDRDKNLEEAFKCFYEVVKRQTLKEEVLKLEFIADTHVGVTKLKSSLEREGLTKIDDIDIYNEDSFYCNCIDNKYIFAIADGVSTACYGSGKIASNIIKNNIEDLWNELNIHIKDKSTVEEFIKEVVIVSNNDINLKVKSENSTGLKDKGDVMASTLIIAIVIGNIMYYTSIGDSKLFIYNKKIGLNLLNYEENVGNYKLLKGQSWSNFNRSDENKILNNYIGGGKILNGDIVSNKVKIEVREKTLFRDDLILLSSDGLTDYISPIYSNNLCNQTLSISRIIKNKDNIKGILYDLIEMANSNGGGDNITSIVAKVN